MHTNTKTLRATSCAPKRPKMILQLQCVATISCEKKKWAHVLILCYSAPQTSIIRKSICNPSPRNNNSGKSFTIHSNPGFQRRQHKRKRTCGTHARPNQPVSLGKRLGVITWNGGADPVRMLQVRKDALACCNSHVSAHVAQYQRIAHMHTPHIIITKCTQKTIENDSTWPTSLVLTTLQVSRHDIANQHVSLVISTSEHLQDTHTHTHLCYVMYDLI
jgi:hypothetical protein